MEPQESVDQEVFSEIKIFKTTQYSRFKLFEYNREKSPNVVAKYVESITKNNLLHIKEILVDKDMNVIDGQHRLEAAKIMQIPIYYRIIDEYNYEDMMDLNDNNTRWTTNDKVRFYAKKGEEIFIKILDIADKFAVSLGAVLYACAGEGNLAKKDIIKSIRIKKELDFVRMEKICSCFKDIMLGTRAGKQSNISGVVQRALMRTLNKRYVIDKLINQQSIYENVRKNMDKVPNATTTFSWEEIING